MSLRRNPRRAYDNEGREIEPMTLGGMRARRVRSLDVTCAGCGHEATVGCDRWADDVPVPDVQLRLRCSKCGSKDLHTMLCMPEYYQTAAVVRL